MRVNVSWADEQPRDYDKKKLHQWYEKKKKTLLMKNNISNIKL